MMPANDLADRELPAGVVQVLDIVRGMLGSTISGVYLFGSSVAGGLRPDSDLDLLVAVRDSLSESVRHALVVELLKVSGGGADAGPARPVELTIVRLADVVPWRYPPRNELVYGEWMRADLEAGRIAPPAADPDLAVVLSKARQSSRTLCGPDASELFDPVPDDDLRRAMADSLPTLVAGIRGDERNVLLTLARMWVTLATGEIVPKDVAARWVLDGLPSEHRDILDSARRAYLGEVRDDLAQRGEEVDAFACFAERAIKAHLARPSGAP